MSADNKTLGTFTLDGIPPAPRGVPQIEVTFDLDSSGILKVTAKDKATGKTQNIQITGAVGLSEDEVKHMQEEAEKHKAEDEKKADLIKAKNMAENMVTTAEKALKDAGRNLTREGVVEALERLKDFKTDVVPPITFGPGRRDPGGKHYIIKVEKGKFIAQTDYRAPR